MKKIYFIIIILSSACSSPKAQDNSTKFVLPRNEVKLSYNMFSLTMGITSQSDITNGFTVSYMFGVTKWFWAGLNATYLFPSETETYRWREYYPDGSFKDFVNAEQNDFFAFAPEFRLTYMNKKWATLYGGFSVGYGIQTGLHKEEYTCWHVTLIGGNWYIGRNPKIFVGGEFGVGYKGVFSIHLGYRF